MKTTKTLKNIVPKAALILLLITVLSSCKSKNQNSTIPEQGKYFLTAKIDGEKLLENSGKVLYFLNSQPMVMDILKIKSHIAIVQS